MNDTTRDELRERVAKAISDTFDMANEYRYNDKSERAQGGVNILAKALSADIVRMVTAARDAEIRELLLSERTVQKAGSNLSGSLEVMDFYEGDDDDNRSSVMVVHWDTEESVARGVIEVALNAIGLGDGTGGQG